MAHNRRLPYPIVFVGTKPKKRFPEVQRILSAIGGKIPDGRDRFILEHGGEATRYFCGYRTAKFRAGYKDEMIGHVAMRRLSDGKMVPVDIPDNHLEWPEWVKAEHAVVVPVWVRKVFGKDQWFISEWISGDRCAKGWDTIGYEWHGGLREPIKGDAPREGIYWPVLQVPDEPNDEIISVLKRYIRLREEDEAQASRNRDEAETEADLLRVRGFMDRALAHEAIEQGAAEKDLYVDFMEREMRDLARVSTHG